MKKVMVVAAAIWSLTVFPAFADDVTDDIGRATQVYQSGDIKKAMAILHEAIGKMNKKRDGFFLSSFPEPMAGWTASEADVNQFVNMFVPNWRYIYRVYTEETGKTMDLVIISGLNVGHDISIINGNYFLKVFRAFADKKNERMRGFELNISKKKGIKRMTLLAGTTVVYAESEDVPEAEMRAYLAKFPLEEF